MTDKLADLHIHTTASDGRLTPSQAVHAAAEIDLAAIAITDHDTAGGIAEALAEADKIGIEVVPGVEISTIIGDDCEIHILGYFIDHKSPDLLKCLAILKDAREQRGRKMVERLNEAGIAIDFSAVEKIAGGGAIGRPHIARAICEIGAAGSLDSAFGRFLQKGGPGYVPRYKLAPQEAIAMIKSAGGVACCAHPGKLRDDVLLNELIEAGLGAIEVKHPDHGRAASKYYRKFAEKRGLIATGGSDAHCFENGRTSAIGSVTISYEVVEQLRKAAGKSS